ncbi:unnamed protein product, partial [Dibothriocephalus latus]
MTTTSSKIFYFPFSIAPKNISVQNVGLNSITALLEPAAGSDNFTLNYTIITADHSGPIQECQATPMPDRPGCTIEGLASGSTYLLTAKACHYGVCSAPSSPVTVKTLGEEPESTAATEQSTEAETSEPGTTTETSESTDTGAN